MPLPKAKLVAFDVDGPLYDGAMIIDFANFLFERGLFRRDAYKRLTDTLKEYKAERINYGEMASSVLKEYGNGIAGQKIEKIVDGAENFIRKNKGKFFPKSVEQLRNLKRQGKKVVLLTLSSSELVTAMGKTLKIPFDYYQGSWFESRNGRYTGKRLVTDIHSFKKDTLIKMSTRFRLPRNRMRMRGDAPSDLASSTAARVPFEPQNPNKELVRILKRPRKNVGRTIITNRRHN